MTVKKLDDVGRLSAKPLAFSPSVFQQALLAWYQTHKRPLPWRVRWQEQADPYTVWVSEIMLQQTVIKAVIPAYERFLARYPDVYQLAAASEDDIKKTVQGLGYYRRFRMLHQACQVLVAASGARAGANNRKQAIAWPTTFVGWKALPGIGDYTAAAIASIAFDEPAAVLDGNVERVLCRIFDVRLPPNLPPLKKQFKVILAKLLASEAPGDFNQGMMELGQTVCTVQAPRCEQCPVQELCKAYQQGSTAAAPQAKVKKEAIATKLRLLIVTRSKGDYALFERPASAKFLKETPGFLTELSFEDGPFDFDGFKAPPPTSLKFTKAKRKPELTLLGSIKHSITHHRITAEVVIAEVEQPQLALPVRWLKRQEVDSQLISNLDRKAWALYQKSRNRLFP